MEFSSYSDSEGGSLANLKSDAVVVSRWGAKWLKYAYNLVVVGREPEQRAKALLEQLDSDEVDEPVDYVVNTTDTLTREVENRDVVEVTVVTKKKSRLQKGKRSQFAKSLGQLAYNKFGERPMSEANLMVTRRWLQKQLESDELKDLRTVDKNIAIDRALFLSFVPTKAFLKMKVYSATAQWEKRVTGSELFGKWWWNRVFGIGVLPDTEDLE